MNFSNKGVGTLDKKTKLTFAIVGGVIVVCIFILFQILGVGKPDEKPKKEKETGHAAHKFSGDEDKNLKKDPFAKEKVKEINVLGHTFEKPVLLEGASVNGSLVQIKGIGKDFIVYLAGNGVLYFYDMKTNERKIVDQKVTDAVVSTDKTRIIFSKEHAVYSFDAEKGILDSTSIMLDVKNVISKVMEANGMVYYTYYDQSIENSPYTTKVFALPEYMNQYSKNQQDSVFENVGKLWGRFENRIYVLEPSTNSIQFMQLGTKEMNTISVSPEFTKLVDFDVTKDNNWIVINQKDNLEDPENGTMNIVWKNNEIKKFEHTKKARWYNEKQILLLDVSSLYLYDTETNQADIITEGANDFTIREDGSILFTNDKEETYVVQKVEKKEKMNKEETKKEDKKAI